MIQVTLLELKSLVRESLYSVYEDAAYSMGDRALRALVQQDLQGAKTNLLGVIHVVNGYSPNDYAPGERAFRSALRSVEQMLTTGDMENLEDVIDVVRIGLGEVTGDESFFEQRPGPGPTEGEYRDDEDRGDYLDKQMSR